MVIGGLKPPVLKTLNPEQSFFYLLSRVIARYGLSGKMIPRLHWPVFFRYI
jgi:hypothetical protein